MKSKLFHSQFDPSTPAYQSLKQDFTDLETQTIKVNDLLSTVQGHLDEHIRMLEREKYEKKRERDPERLETAPYQEDFK